jgi:hypothetical protein
MALPNLKSSDAATDADDPEDVGAAEPASGEGTQGQPLTSAEYATIRAAAEAGGYSSTFADLLCRFAELIGVEQVLLELGQLKELFKEEPPPRF